MRTAAINGALRNAVLAALAAAAVNGAMIAAFTGRAIVGLGILGGALCSACLLLSGNPRLFCLWGMLLAAPLDLSKRFVIIAHMGGASAFRIELVDFFMAGLLLFLLQDLVRGYRRGVRFSGVAVYWVLLMLLGVGTVVVGPFRTLAAQEVFRMAKCLVLFLIVINEVVRVRQFQHVLLALLAGVLLEAALGLAQYAFNLRLGLQALGEAQERTIEALSEATLQGGAPVYRVGALIGHANLLAAYLALLLPIGVAVLFARIRLPAKILCGAAVVLGEMVLVATLSRSGWIAFGAALAGVLALTFLHPRMRRRYTVARGALIAAALVVAVVFSGPITARLYRSDPGAVQVRWEWLGTAWKMIQEKPVLGFGLNSYVFRQAPYTRYGSPAGLQDKYGDDWPAVHNVYALTWAEQGTVGLLIYVAMHAHIIAIGLRNLRVRNDVLYAVNIGCLCGVGAILIDSLASFFVRVDGCARVYWIVIGTIVAVDYWRRANEPASRARDLDEHSLPWSTCPET